MALCCTTASPARVTAGDENFPVPGGMLETAENLHAEVDIPREEQDRRALRSHQRAVAAQQDGRFHEESTPVTVRDRRQATIVIDRDGPPPACHPARWASGPS